jgi:hypothetical protein
MTYMYPSTSITGTALLDWGAFLLYNTFIRIKPMRLYSQSYYLDNYKSKKKKAVIHYILRNCYKDRSLFRFSIHKHRSNYFMFNRENCLMEFGFKIWNNKAFELQIFGWDY